MPLFTCLSPNGVSVTAAQGPIGTLKVGTIRGIYTLEQKAGAWTVTHKALEQFQISALLHEPRSGRLFAATHGARGLWASDDSGQTWTQKTAGLDRPHVYTLAKQERGDKVALFCGTEPASAYRSDDLGETWQEFKTIQDLPGKDRWYFPPPPHVGHGKNFAFHPTKPDTWYLCIEQGALARTDDAGKTWINIEGYDKPDEQFYRDNHRLVMRRSKPEQMYLAGGEGVFGTIDGGATWTHLQTRHDRVGYPDAMFIDPRDDRTVIIGGAFGAPERWRENRTANAAVLRSADDGRTWQVMDKGLPNPVVGNIEAMALHHWGDQVTLLAGTATGQVYAQQGATPDAAWTVVAADLPPISKAGHYRHFLSPEEKAKIEAQMRVWNEPVRA